MLFFSAMRCLGCGRRYHRVNLWPMAATIAVGVLIAFTVAVIRLMWTHYDGPTAPPLPSLQEVVR